VSALFAGAMMQIVLQVADPATPKEAHPQIVETTAAETPPSEPPRAPMRPDVFVSGELGYGRGSLFGQAMTGATGTASLGLSIPQSFGSIFVAGDAEYDALDTARGIGIHRLAVGVVGGVQVWHLQLGAGADVGSTWIARVSGSDMAANELFLGLHGFVGVDLFTVGGFTPYVQGRVDVNTVMPTLSANMGLRYKF
jgi:hypothetical protein